jgi:hypothetical protein
VKTYKDAARSPAAARERAASSSVSLTVVLDRAADGAPHKPGFWSKVGHVVSAVVGAAGNVVLDTGVDVLNMLASVGERHAEPP